MTYDKVKEEIEWYLFDEFERIEPRLKREYEFIVTMDLDELLKRLCDVAVRENTRYENEGTSSFKYQFYAAYVAMIKFVIKDRFENRG